MREIKLRAWERNAKRMSFTDTDLRVDISDGGLYVVDSDGDFENYVLMQCTGLKDKNDKEIYEGDIIAIGGNRKLVGHIEYDAPSFVMAWDKARPRVEIINAFKEPIWCNSHISLEVIGNIYENPELLSKEEL